MKKIKLDLNDLTTLSGGEISHDTNHVVGSGDKEDFIRQLLTKNSDILSKSDAMRLQYQLMQLNLQSEMTTKPSAGGDSVSQLFKN